MVDFRKGQPAGQLEKYAQVTGDIDAIHFVGHAAPIPLLLQFANFEQYFDKTSMEHYVAAASDPKKVLYYDTGHDLNDPQALEDRYDWLVKNISPADAAGHQLRTWRRLPERIPVCHGLLMGDFSPDSMRSWKA
jgi:hypothetical protein